MTIKPDVLYVIDSWTLPLVYLATIGRFRSRGWKFVYHTFDWLEPGLDAWWNAALERRACRSADLVVNVDRSRARLQRTLYRLALTPLDLPNYRSLNYPVPERNSNVRKRLFEDCSDETVVVVCPTLASAPRLTIELIEGLRFLPDRYRVVTFATESAYARLCHRRAEALGLQDRVRFLAPGPHSEWLEVVANSDVGIIFHDVEESSGYFMANSDRLGSFVACGLPVVCMDVPNLEALVYRHNLGTCCSPRSPRAVADAIRAVAEPPARLTAWRSSVRKVFLESLNFESVGERLLDRLDTLADPQRHRSVHGELSSPKPVEPASEIR
jgi:glycosyltransferase involved in cell wall biosynthesis